MLSVVQGPREEKAEDLAPTLDEIAREGARRMLIQALEEEVAAYLAAHEERNEEGRRQVVRNGKARHRKVTLETGTVEVRAPRVNDRRIDAEGRRQRVRQADPVEERVAPGLEEAAVVGRHAHGGVPLAHGAEEVLKVVVVVSGDGAEGVAVVQAIPEPDPDAAEGVVVVARVLSREEVPVLGVQDEQQPIEERQAGPADLVQVGGGEGLGALRVVLDECSEEVREDPLEDDGAQVGGNPLLPAAALVQGLEVEAPALGVGRVRQEGPAAEEEEEDPEIVAAPLRVVVGVRVAVGGLGGASTVGTSPEREVRDAQESSRNSSDRERAPW